MTATPDDQINLDDIPELTDAQLAEMKRVERFRPVKKADRRPSGRLCARLAQGLRQGLPVSDECHLAAGDAEREVTGVTITGGHTADTRVGHGTAIQVRGRPYRSASHMDTDLVRNMCQ